MTTIPTASLKGKVCYLTSPYADPERWIRAERIVDAAVASAALWNVGLLVFSPIVYSAQIVRMGAPSGYDDWMPLELRLLSACDELIVLMLDGWEESKGIKEEIEWMQQHHPFSANGHLWYLSPDDLEILRSEPDQHA
jgi:hypothetical protein